jgi:hypothetical protein
MMGAGNRMNTAQSAWNWATVTSGAGTDSITWTYDWGTDSLIAGENFVCAQPLESDAGTTNNEGLGTPFAGNIEVYPVYRMGVFGGIVNSRQELGVPAPTLSVFPNPCPGKARITYSLPRSGNVSLKLYDVTGKLAATLRHGYANAGRYSLLLTPTLSSERRGGNLTTLSSERRGGDPSSKRRGVNPSSEKRGGYLAQGVYLLRLATGSASMTRKLIVE